MFVVPAGEPTIRFIVSLVSSMVLSTVLTTWSAPAGAAAANMATVQIPAPSVRFHDFMSGYPRSSGRAGPSLVVCVGFATHSPGARRPDTAPRIFAPPPALRPAGINLRRRRVAAIGKIADRRQYPQHCVCRDGQFPPAPCQPTSLAKATAASWDFTSSLRRIDSIWVRTVLTET